MRLVKLTPSSAKPKFIYVSADQITSIEDRNVERVVYTSHQGMYFYVREAAEEIEALANSSSETPINYRHILAFIHWDQDNAIRFLGRSIHDKIDAFISETR